MGKGDYEEKQETLNRFDYVQDQTARRLMLALAHCMEREPIDRIRTSDILQEAHVSRTTFYRHYRDKYDMVNRNYQFLLDRTIGKIGREQTFRESFLALYHVLRTDPAFYRNALSSVEPDSLRQYIYRQSYDLYTSLLSEYGLDMKKHYNKMLLTGFISGTLTLTCIWAEEGMKDDPQVMFELCYDLMPYEFRKCFFVHFS